MCDGFDVLQARLPELWARMTLGASVPRRLIVVVVQSLPVEIVPGHLAPVFPAYDERFLCLVLTLLRAPSRESST